MINNDRLIRACRRQSVDRAPVWMMRQAGRYQPSYRAIREKVSFLELCHDPDLCAEVAVRAVDDTGVDAAIVFADILLVLEPLGIGFEFTAGDGPQIGKPIRSARDVDAVASEIDADGSRSRRHALRTVLQPALQARGPARLAER